MPARPASQLEKPSQPACQPPARGDAWRSNQSTSMQVCDKDQGPPLSRHPLNGLSNHPCESGAHLDLTRSTKRKWPHLKDMSWCLSILRPAGMITIEIICACEFHFTRSAKKIKKGCFMAFDGLGSMVKRRSSKRQPALQNFDDRQGEKAWKGVAPNGSQRFKILTIDRKRRATVWRWSFTLLWRVTISKYLTDPTYYLESCRIRHESHTCSELSFWIDMLRCIWCAKQQQQQQQQQHQQQQQQQQQQQKQKDETQ